MWTPLLAKISSEHRYVGWIGRALWVSSLFFWLAGVQFAFPFLRAVAGIFYFGGIAIVWGSASRNFSSPLHQALLWAAAATLLLLPILVFSQGAEPVVFHYYGWIWFTYLCVHAVLGALLGEFALYAQRAIATESLGRREALLNRLFWIFLCGAALMMLGAGVFLVGVRANIIVAIFWFFGILPFYLAAAIAAFINPRIDRTLARESVVRWAARPISMLVICGAFLLVASTLNLTSIRVFPVFMNTDEPWKLNFVDTINRTGHLGATLIIDSPVAKEGYAYEYAAAAWDALWAHDVFSQRTFSTLAGFLLLAVLFGIGTLIQDARTGLYAVVLMASNLVWLTGSHIGRPDMWITLAIWLAFLLIILARRRKSGWLAFCAGLAAALTAFVHLPGVVFCIAVGLWWLLDWPTAWQERRLLALFIAGGLVGGIIYVAIEVLPATSAYLKALGAISDAEYASPWAILYDQQYAFFLANPMQAILLWGALLWALYSGGQARRMAIITTLLAVGLAVVVSYKNIYYQVLYTPGIILAFALVLRRVSWPRAIAVATLIVATFLFNVKTISQFSTENWNQRVVSDVKQVAKEIPAEGKVMSMPIFYMGFRSPRLIAFTPYNKRFNVVAIAPDFIVSGENVFGFSSTYHAMSYLLSMEIEDPIVDSAYEVYKKVHTSLGTFTILQKKPSDPGVTDGNPDRNTQ